MEPVPIGQPKLSNKLASKRIINTAPNHWRCLLFVSVSIMTTPESPSTTPTKPPPASPASTNSSSSGSHNSNGTGCTSRDTVVQQAASALVEAASIYKNQDAIALSKGENYDDFVKVELPGGLSIDQLGDACSIAKCSVGKLKVVAFQTTGEVFVRQVASGYTHGEAAGEVFREISNATLPYSRRPHRFVGVGYDGMYGTHIISAPDVTVRSLGRSNGEPTRGLEDGPRYFAEVEDGNRSLLELIRHLGMLLANFPNLNGALGIKGEEDANGNKRNALISIEWHSVAGIRQPHVTNLVDFGPDPISDIRRNNANHALTLPLPALGEKTRAGVHGTGVTVPLPGWTRFSRGQDAQGNPAIITIPPTLLFGGARSTGAHSTIIDIHANAIPANINLQVLVDIYFS